MKNNFYRAFEERWRGSREAIKERQNVYLPFIEPLHKYYPYGTVFDIGCGRGEWLELMHDHSIPAKGIDLDEGMLEAGLTLGLEMQKGDGIDFLRNAADESAIAITAFHVVEHISFDQLQDLISEAHRVLKPGGIIILETPNPENIRVACESFYLDPTHTKPIPSGLLSFVTEYYGYRRNKIVRLQESEMLSAQKYANIGQLLEGSSPDYAVIAQKETPDEKFFASFEMLFSSSYGLSLSDLTEKVERRMLRFEEMVDKIIHKTAKAEEFAWQSEISAREAQESAKSAEINARNAWLHYQTVVNSYSWKLALPLRLAEKVARKIKRISVKTGKRSFQVIKQKVENSPVLRRNIHKVLNRFPGFKQKLKSLLQNKKIEEGTTMESPKILFPDTKTITSDLMKKIEQKKREK